MRRFPRLLALFLALPLIGAACGKSKPAPEVGTTAATADDAAATTPSAPDAAPAEHADGAAPTPDATPGAEADAAAPPPDASHTVPSADAAAASTDTTAPAAGLPEADPDFVPELTSTASSSANDMALDVFRIDLSRWTAEGVIVLRGELVSSQTGRVVPPPAGAKVTVSIDGKPVAGEVALRTAGGEPIALGLVVPMHRSYAVEAELANGLTFNAADAIADGLAALAGGAPEGSRVAAWVIDEDGTRELAAFGAPPSLVARRIAGQPRTPLAAPQLAPRLYASLERALGSFGAAAAELPARRALVIVNDGKDADADKPAEQDKTVARLAGLARDIGVRPIVLGVTLDQPEPLVNLQTLATRAGGSYREIPFDSLTSLASQVADLGRAFADELVIEVRPAGVSGGAPVSLAVELTTDDGGRARRVREGVQLPARAATP